MFRSMKQVPWMIWVGNSILEIQFIIGPLQDPVTWYKITYTGKQVVQWDLQNNVPAFVLEVPLRNLLTSICNFVPCDPVLQRAYSLQLLKGAALFSTVEEKHSFDLSWVKVYFSQPLVL